VHTEFWRENILEMGALQMKWEDDIKIDAIEIA
jgi:hypothetical protein